MALTTPKMSLSVWNQLTDPYDHAQLADNFSKIDFHDHTPGRGVLIPTEGIADGAVTVAKLATVLDPTLGYNTYKNVVRARGWIGASAPAAATYILPVSSTAVAAAAGTSSLVKDTVFYINPTDYAVSGKNTVLRMRGSVANNATAPGTNFTFGLYPVSVVGGLTTVETSVTTLGSVISGSTVVFTAPSASVITAIAGTDFAAPAAGFYVIGVLNSGASDGGSRPSFSCELQVRQT